MPLTTVKGAVLDTADILEDTTAAAFRATIEVDRAVQTKTTTYTQLATDVNNLIRFTSAGNYDLLAAATAGADFHVSLMADGGAITIDPDGVEQVNGASTLVVADGDSGELFCDGSAWYFLSIQAAATATQHKINGTTKPLATDDSNAGYSVRSNWIDTTADKAYICVDASVSAAVWVEVNNVAANSITLAKLEHQTSGDILYYGASGTPSVLNKGTDDQVLTLASGLPSWQDTSGGWELVSSETISGTTGELDFDSLDTDTYEYGITLEGVTNTATSTSLYMLVKDNGTLKTDANYNYCVFGMGSTTSAVTVSATNASSSGIYLDKFQFYVDSRYDAWYRMYKNRLGYPALIGRIIGSEGSAYSGSPRFQDQQVSGCYEGTIATAWDGIRFDSTGTLENGGVVRFWRRAVTTLDPSFGG